MVNTLSVISYFFLQCIHNHRDEGLVFMNVSKRFSIISLHVGTHGSNRPSVSSSNGGSNMSTTNRHTGGLNGIETAKRTMMVQEITYHQKKGDDLPNFIHMNFVDPALYGCNLAKMVILHASTLPLQ